MCAELVLVCFGFSMLGFSMISVLILVCFGFSIDGDLKHPGGTF